MKKYSLDFGSARVQIGTLSLLWSRGRVINIQVVICLCIIIKSLLSGKCHVVLNSF